MTRTQLKTFALSLLTTVSIAYAQIQFNGYPPAHTPLSGSEILVLLQTSSGCPSPGCTVQATVAQVAAAGGGGTPGGANTNVQFNNAGAFGGVNDFSWILGTDTLLLGSSSLAPTIQPNAVAATANGISLTINGGFDGVTSGTAGALNLNGGSSQTTGNAGAVNITGGNVQNNTGSGTGTAGAVNIIGGGTASFFSGTVVGGSVNISGGAGLGGHNGNVSITGGQGLNGSDAPGNVTIAAGSTAVQGQVTVHSGQSTLFLQQQGTPEWSLGNSAVVGNRLTGTSIGGVQLGAPTGGDCGAGCFAPQSVRIGNGTANVFTATITGSSTSGQSLGVKIAAGTTTGDTALSVTNQGGSVTFLTIPGNGQIAMPALNSSSAADTGTVCWNGTGGTLSVDTTTTCLASSIRFKQAVQPLDVGLAAVRKFRPVSYELKPQYNPKKLGRQVGLIAEEVQKIDPRLVSLDADGLPRGVRYEQLTAVLIKAIQEQQAEIEILKTRCSAKGK